MNCQTCSRSAGRSSRSCLAAKITKTMWRQVSNLMAYCQGEQLGDGGLRNLFARPATRTIRTAPRRTGLSLEALEDRWVPSAVTVGNLTDAVNGDTSSIAALINNPGADGISLREAVAAA